MPSILCEIVEHKKQEIEEAKVVQPIALLKKAVVPSTRSLYTCLKGKHNIIAEIKFKSPSAGQIRATSSLKEIVMAYDRYASALSILTDKPFFGGDVSYLKEAKKYTALPILRKDFIIDEYQIYESRYYGADAILLIASLLSAEQIDLFIGTAATLGMECVVEVHTADELKKVLQTKARIIGINNRDLQTFEVDMNLTKILKANIPPDKLVVAESGITTKEDILTLDTNAVLVGTVLMGSDRIAAKLRELHRCKLKICGIIRKEDAVDAVAAGVDFLGFNFYKKSPRYISPEHAQEIISSLPVTVQTVGVFVNSSWEDVAAIASKTGIDFIQLHGDEDEEFAKKMERPVIQVLKVKGNKIEGGTKVHTYAALYDTYDPALCGGTGKAFDTKVLKDAVGKIFVAGGVTASNIQERLAEIHPFCIDVCSGVEEAPGIKNTEKIIEIFQAVKNYET